MLRAIHAACTTPGALPGANVLRLAALELRRELPAVLRARDARRLKAAGLIDTYAASLLRAFPTPGDADRLQTAADLLGLGLPLRLVRPALEAWDTEAAAKVSRDPYGALFHLKATLDEADALAARCGAGGFEARVAQHALWLLRAARREGHTMLPVATVVERALARARAARPDATAAHVLVALRAAVDAGTLATLGPEEGALAEPEVLRDEAFVAAKVRELVVRRALDPADVALQDQEGLTPEQMAAVEAVTSAGLAVLTGGPGTGKTTVVRALVRALGAGRCMLTAPTGRAARNVAGSTIHSASGGVLLRRPIQETTRADVPEGLALMVVDEASMLSTELMVAVLNLLPPACHLLLVGDADQLPPVGTGNVLKDLLACGAVPAARLSYNHRSASDVQRLAAEVLAGRVPEAAEIVQAATPAACMTAVVGAAGAGGAQVLTPHNAQRALLNRALQSCRAAVPVVCPQGGRWGAEDGAHGALRTDPGTGRATVRFADGRALEMAVDGALTITRPRDPMMVGDAVMVIKNQNKKRLRVGEVSACNGDVGRLERHVPKPAVRFADGSTAEFAAVDGWLTLAYAATVHKFQGSECEEVVLPLVPHSMWDRHLLYTAITRAKARAVLIGSREDLRAIVARVRPDRHSALRVLLSAV